MSHQIWAYKLEAKTRQEIEMPWGSKVLKIAVVGNAPLVWVLVDTQAPTRQSVFFAIYECDEPIPDADQLQYLGTIAMADQEGAERVLHCFQVKSIIQTTIERI